MTRLRETAYLLLGLPMSVVAFAVLVAGSTAGSVLALTVVGLPVLLGFAYAARGVAWVERRRAAMLVGPVAERYRPTAAEPLLRRLRLVGGDPATWRDLLWLLVVSIAGFAGGILAASVWAALLWGLTLPVYWWSLPHPALPQLGPGWYADTWPRVLLVFTAALVLLAPALWLLRAFARGQALAARAVLSPGKTGQLEGRVHELRQTRAAAADTQTEELRRIERDLHDGAQARLVALAIDLGLAREKLDGDPAAARALVDAAHDDAKAALAELRELVRGVHPAVLADRGLEGALTALAARSPVPVALEIEPGVRPAPSVEAAAYFVVAEGLANVAKHSGARRSIVRIQRPDGRLVVEVADDGAGGADALHGTGLAGLEHRVRALDGTLHVESPAGGPTTLRAELPCAS